MSKFEHLIGRSYTPGRNDCYSLVRDYYREVWGLQLPNVARPDEFWMDPHLDLYSQYQKHGFEVVTSGPMQIGDAFLMPILTQMNSHAAVLVGDNEILHHMPGQLSRTDKLRPKWWDRITIHLRHPKITQAHEQQPIERVPLHEQINHHLFQRPEFQEAVERAEHER